MTAVPDSFRAYLATREGAGVRRGPGTLGEADLPRGDVTVRVSWSSVNYKDALATVADGKVARISPLVPGIDLAGVVVASADPTIPVGRPVIVHGYELGVAHHGGYAEYARVPGGWVVPLPAGLTPCLAMAIGTAGFTAAMAVLALEDRGLRPGDGPVLVTGAAGGVGTTAVGILAARGHETWAATGKPGEADRLRGLGAAGIVSRGEVTAASARPLEAGRWAAAIDCVGGATLPYVLRTLRQGGTVAAAGNAGGAALATTVLPFILRGVALLGMDSAHLPIEARRATWERLATDLRPRGLGEGLTEVTLDTLTEALDGILAGRARGRWIVRIGA